MVAPSLTSWGGSLHQSFRLLPTPSAHLKIFLESDGQTPAEILKRLPYDANRAGDRVSETPDPKRYRDARQVYQTAGLLYEMGPDGDDDDSPPGYDSDRRVKLTPLGRASARWLSLINEKNSVILGRHAAYSLSACQLRNPSRSGMKYSSKMVVFPFAFIWRAMLALDNKLNSEELSRAIFKVQDEDSLGAAIANIRDFRATGSPEVMGPPTETHNDRLIPWMSIASFGWTLFNDKKAASATGYYEIPLRTLPIVREASRLRHKHQMFHSTLDYMRHLERAAALPSDLR
jgi:hypothetical protein